MSSRDKRIIFFVLLIAAAYGVVYFVGFLMHWAMIAHVDPASFADRISVDAEDYLEVPELTFDDFMYGGYMRPDKLAYRNVLRRSWRNWRAHTRTDEGLLPVFKFHDGYFVVLNYDERDGDSSGLVFFEDVERIPNDRQLPDTLKLKKVRENVYEWHCAQYQGSKNQNAE